MNSQQNKQEVEVQRGKKKTTGEKAKDEYYLNIQNRRGHQDFHLGIILSQILQ